MTDGVDGYVRPSWIPAGDRAFDDMAWVPANSRSMHFVNVRAAMPKGVHREVSAPQIAFGLGKVASPTRLLELMFYGDQWKRSAEFTGLATYFGTCDATEAQCAENVIDLGSRGDRNASLWLVCWSPESVYWAHGIDETGEPRAAIVPADWRYVVRIANFDVSAGLVELAPAMLKAMLRVPTLTRFVRPVWYASPCGAEMLRDQVGPFTHFHGIPIRALDALRDNESPVTRLAA